MRFFAHLHLFLTDGIHIRAIDTTPDRRLSIELTTTDGYGDITLTGTPQEMTDLLEAMRAIVEQANPSNTPIPAEV